MQFATPSFSLSISSPLLLHGTCWFAFTTCITNLFHARQAPNLRTVGIERVTPAGLDFVIKRGTGVAQVLAEGQAMSFLHTQGLFLPGQSAEQWRGEGSCVVLPLSEVLDQVPHFVITSMVGSKRIAAERTGGWPVDEDSAASSSSNSSATDEAEADGASTRVRESVDSRTHLTEVMQQTRIELENGDVTLEELDECMQAFRLQPVRMECMWASPDSSVLWDRWEWQREVAADDSQSSDVHASLLWVDPRNLVPH
jgi:hypothetical protein